MSATYHHMGIACQDPAKIEAFYSKYFGFERKRVLPLPDGTQIVFIKSGDNYLELFQAKEKTPVPPAVADGPWYPGWRHIAFMVDDVDAKLAELGDDARITLGPYHFDAFIPGWYTAWIADPEGNIVEITQGYTD
jgi:glyoxylase I family protein